MSSLCPSTVLAVIAIAAIRLKVAAHGVQEPLQEQQALASQQVNAPVHWMQCQLQQTLATGIANKHVSV